MVGIGYRPDIDSKFMRKYPAKIYAKALSEVLSKGLGKKELESALENFLELVKKNQDQKSLAKIFPIAQKILLAQFGIDKFTFESARPLEEKNLRKLKEILAQKDVFEEKLSPELMAGLKIIKNGNEQIDFSLSNKIKKVFSQI